MPRHPPDALQTLDLNSNENAKRHAQEQACSRADQQGRLFPPFDAAPSQPSPCGLWAGRGASSVTCTSSSLVHDPAPAPHQWLGATGPGAKRPFLFTFPCCGSFQRSSKSGGSPLPSTPIFLAETGGGRRDRTDDLLLAKQALSQLSYAPVWCQAVPPDGWWAREDLNLRPHAYQARALTN